MQKEFERKLKNIFSRKLGVKKTPGSANFEILTSGSFPAVLLSFLCQTIVV
jgi:hypothetical protein